MNDWRSRLWYDFNFCTVWTLYSLLFSYRCRGFQHVPKNGPVLVLANHESYLDPIAVGLAVRRRVKFLARHSLFRPPWFGDYLRSVGCIEVDQSMAKEGLRKSIQLLQAGEALIIFPEGQRTPTGQMLPFRRGIDLVLRKAPVPIVPVGVAGAYEAYPLHAPMPRFSPLFWPPTGAAVAAQSHFPA